VAATHAAGEVDAKQQGYTPAKVHREVVPGGSLAEHELGHRAIADEHEDEGADELGHVRAHVRVANGVGGQSTVAFEVSVASVARFVLGHR
jgi:hypothetical protein